MVKQADIAAAAGVSVGTVSHVLGGKGEQRRISAETRQRVMQAARSLGYTRPDTRRDAPYDAAQSREPDFALLFNRDLATSIMGEMLRGITNVRLSSNYGFRVIVYPLSAQDIQDINSRIAAMRCDGVIIAGIHAYDTESMKNISASVPVMFVNNPSPMFNSVNMDAAAILRSVMKMFGRKPDKRAAFILSRGFLQCGGVDPHRMRVWFDPMCREYGVEGALTLSDIHATQQFGYDAARRIMQGGDRPRLLFISQPMVALGFMRACRDMGVNIPADVELLSCGAEKSGEFTTPTLSTAHYSADKNIEYVLNLLLNNYYRNDQGPQTINLTPSFTFRESFQPE